MYDQGKEENTRLIFSRASCIFVSISPPAVRLAWARFEEKLGCVSVARDIYVAILDQKPEHGSNASCIFVSISTTAILALANLELEFPRRCASHWCRSIGPESLSAQSCRRLLHIQ
jgi:hypothetical protein